LITGGDDFMEKKIVCIGWGSLLWQLKELKIKGEWHNDGPAIPVEFVRESSGKRITLVIDRKSKPMQTLWVIMGTTNIEEAIESLKEREDSKMIDFIQATDETDDPIKKIIRDWLQIKGIDVAIYTGLGHKFNKKDKRPTVEEVITHLKSL